MNSKQIYGIHAYVKLIRGLENISVDFAISLQTVVFSL